jgi:hypothetical protein
MRFHATNYTISIALLMAATVFVAGVRFRKPLENNWPLFYWIFVTVLSLRFPEQTFEAGWVLTGLAAGLLLRFEFIGGWVTVLIKVIELAVWGFILYHGLIIVMTS